MRSLLLLMLFLALGFGGCGPSSPPAPAGARGEAGEAVVSWKGGTIGLAELESQFAEARTPACRRARRGGIEELLACYRELAEGLVLERLVTAQHADLEGALRGLEGREQLRRQLLLELYLRRLNEGTDISEGEIAGRFEADPSRYATPGALTLSNIFRRHDDPGRPEATEAFLRAVRDRFLAGETFESLARELSHSETRGRGGLVGTVREDELPPRLRRAALALGEGEVSEPIRVRDGAVLLYLHGVVAGGEPSLNAARGQIRRELRGERIAGVIRAKVGDREPPADAMVLSFDALLAALDGGDPERTVLEIAGDRVEASELRRLAGLAPGKRAAALDVLERDRLAALYQGQKERALLAIDLLTSAPPELQEAAEEQLREASVDRLVEEEIRREMEAVVEGEPSRLADYFEDNRHHYQSPLRFNLRLWTLPFGDDPPGQLRAMERVAEELAAGAVVLAGAAETIGGTVEELGWKTFDELGEVLPEKAVTYLMEVGGQGFTVPYQHRDALHLVELEGREEPQPLSYEEALDPLRTDYLERFEEQLFRQVLELRLGAAGFAFDETAVRRLLES